MNINFVGDLILGDQPVKFGFGFDSLHSATKYKGIFDGVQYAFNKSDFNVANFEAIIKKRTDNCTISNWSMCCDAYIIDVLRDADINIVSIANNHTMDYGLEHFSNTVNKLREASIKVIGLKSKPYEIIDNGKIRVALIGVSYLKVKSLEVPYFLSPTLGEWTKLLENIKKEQVDKTIAFIHWGNEFVDHPVEKQRRILEQIMDLNVDALVGHHPHVLQPNYIFCGKPVFFSLGNFISDYWQDRARQTTILNLNINDKIELQWRSYECYINNTGCPEILADIVDVKLNDADIIFADLKDINYSRKILRLDYSKMLIQNFYKIKNKSYFLGWLWRRFVFIMIYGKMEKRNPDLIYEKYKH